MQTMLKMMSTLMILNIFLYIGVNFSIGAENGRELNKDYDFYFEGDLLDTFMGGNQDFGQLATDTKDNWTNYDIGLNANFTTRPTQQGGTDVGTGGISFLDAIGIVWDFILTVCNIIIAPLTLFFNFRMPIFIGLLIGVPYFFVLVFTLFGFIRGVSG